MLRSLGIYDSCEPQTFSTCDVSSLCNVTGTNLEGDIVTATSLDCLRCLYGTFSYVPKVPDLNMIGVTNYLNEVSVITALWNYRSYGGVAHII